MNLFGALIFIDCMYIFMKLILQST